MPPYGSCLLGSINLTKFVVNAFTPSAYFDYDAYDEAIRIFSRMLDNVVEVNGLPLPQQEKEIRSKRRHGMGFLGLGSACVMLGIKYGDKDSLELTEKVSYHMALEGYATGVELAREKGSAPALEDKYEMTDSLFRKNGNAHDLKIGESYPGREYMVRSGFMTQFNTTDRGRQLLQDIKRYGCRYTHAVSIAPTGTISLSLANNASNGIEPSFTHHYFRNVIVEGQNTKKKVSVYSFEYLAYREHMKEFRELPPEDDTSWLPPYFISVDTLQPNNHVDIQAAAQKWVDSSISKTTNVATDFPFADFQNVYMYASDMGLKGCTTFRFNPEAFQGVLVTQKDLDNTEYEFKLEDGTVLRAKGSDQVEYNGEVTSAANLFDALKEGYYGAFNTTSKH